MDLIKLAGKNITDWQDQPFPSLSSLQEFREKILDRGVMLITNQSLV
jgi:hypothetical protein